MADWYISSTAWTAIPQFAASTAYTVGQIVRPLTAPAVTARYAFRCTTAGTSSTEPSWPAPNNSTVTTGGATFTNVSGQSAYGWSAAAGTLLSMGNESSNRNFTAGDRIFLSSDHSESAASNYTPASITQTFGVLQFISVNRAGSVPPVAADETSGASITITSGTPTLNCAPPSYWKGITWNFTGSGAVQIGFSGYGNKTFCFKNCAFVLGASSAGFAPATTIKIILDATPITFGAVGQSFMTNYMVELIWINTPSALGGATFPTNLFTSSGYPLQLITCRGVDFSSLAGTLLLPSVTANLGGTKLLLDSCRINSAVTRFGTVNNASHSLEETELVNCYNGTSVLNERYNPVGAVTTDRTTYLTGGAQDDIGNYSLKLVSNTRSDKWTFPLDCFAFDVENTATGTSKTATVEIVSSGTLNNDDISLQLEYMGTSGNPLASFTSSLPSSLATPSALTTSSATWATGNNYYNSADATANILLTNNNLTVASNNSSNGGVRAASGYTAGKYYWEVTCGTIFSNDGFGIGSATTPLTNIASTGAQKCMVLMTNGSIWLNGTNPGSASVGTVSNGSLVGIAVDFTNQLFWARLGAAGNWNGSGTANPATGTGGIALGLSGVMLYPMVNINANTTSYTTNFGGSAFTGAVPSGFTSGASFVGTNQKLQATFTPQRAGRVRGLIRLGKTSTTVWVDPRITIT